MSGSWNDLGNVLCVRLDTIGDVLMTAPAMRALRRSVAGRRISLLTSPAGAEAAALLPEVDDVLVYEAPWMKASGSRSDPSSDHAMIRRLRASSFDGAVIFTVYTQSPLPAALVCFLAEIPRRAAHCRENPYDLLTEWIPEPEPDQLVRHEVRRQLDLAAALGCQTDDERLRVRIPPEARGRAEALLEEAGIDRERPWAVVHPGATAPSRRYPAEHYVAVVRRLRSEHGWQILFTGTGDEVELVESIRGAAGGPSLAGRLDVAELAGVLEQAPLLIAGNTGPVHVAAAVGTAVVDLYALTNPQHAPWGVPHVVLSHDVPCKYCYKSVCPLGHHDCLRLVDPERVVQAATELYGSARRLADVR